jgi:cardiolipin synthase
VLRHLPNLLSVLRLVLVPVTIWLIVRNELCPAFYVFVVAGLTDALDGFLAKRLNAVSKLGAYLDPLADKALLVGINVTLSIGGYLPLWLVLLIVFRDLLIVGGALLVHALTHRLEMQPLWISKLNTLLQIVLAAYVLAMSAFGFSSSLAAMALIYLTAITTVASGAAYVVTWLRKLHQWEQRS